MPVLEANPNSRTNLRYHLVTRASGTTRLLQITGVPDSFTLGIGDTYHIVPNTVPASILNSEIYTVVVSNRTGISIVGQGVGATAPVISGHAIIVQGTSFIITGETTTINRTAYVSVYGNTSGAQHSMTVTIPRTIIERDDVIGEGEI